MARVLVDSNILIAVLRRHEEVISALTKLSEDAVPICSALSIYEVEQGARPDEIDSTRRFLEAFDVAPVNHAVAQKAAELVRASKRSIRQIDPIDFLIAATCLVHRYELLTLNRKDFQFPDLQLHPAL